MGPDCNGRFCFDGSLNKRCPKAGIRQILLQKN